MLQSAKKHSSLIFVILASLTFVTFALAHETNDPHPHAVAQVDASASASAEAEVRPLDLVRQRAMQIKQNAIGAKAQLQANTAADLDAAQTPEERRAVLQGAADARIDIARERQASSTNLVRKVRDLVRQHAGLIKERFALALRQFDKLATRIESRIEKLKARGVATATVEAELDAAKTANAEAKADVQAVADFVANVDENADRAQVRTELQALIKTAQTSVREAHQALQKTVRSLVQLAKENKPAANASTTLEVEADATVNE